MGPGSQRIKLDIFQKVLCVSQLPRKYPHICVRGTMLFSCEVAGIIQSVNSVQSVFPVPSFPAIVRLMKSEISHSTGHGNYFLPGTDNTFIPYVI